MFYTYIYAKDAGKLFFRAGSGFVERLMWIDVFIRFLASGLVDQHNLLIADCLGTRLLSENSSSRSLWIIALYNIAVGKKSEYKENTWRL